ncbi:MAG: ABC transporter ATP-binding protein [Armatimonadota bacterium]
MDSAIRIEGLTKSYLNKTTGVKVAAVDDLHLEVFAGEIFGFLGPNGAGKTTTIKMLLGLIFPDKGDAFILGKPIGESAVRKQVAYLPESPYFYDYLTGRQVLEFYGKLFGIRGKELRSLVDKLLEQVGLTRDGDKLLRSYSKGMQQRIGIAQALINDPQVLFLDEPTSGLDPLARLEIRDTIMSLKAMGKTVFLSSHQLLEVEVTCDRISILNKGKLLRQGKLEELLPSGKMQIVTSVAKSVEPELRALGAELETDHDGLLIASVPLDVTVDKAIDVIRKQGGSIKSVTQQRRSLEQLFVDTIEGESK